MRKGFFGRSTQVLIAANLIAALTIAQALVFPAAPSAAAAATESQDESLLPEFGNTALTPPGIL